MAQLEGSHRCPMCENRFVSIFVYGNGDKMLIKFLKFDFSEIHKNALPLLNFTETNYSFREHLNLYLDRDVLSIDSLIGSHVNHKVTLGDLVESYLTEDFGRVF